MSENTPQPAAPQQPQFTQQAPAAQPASGAPVEAPKKEEVGGCNRVGSGHYFRTDRHLCHWFVPDHPRPLFSP